MSWAAFIGAGVAGWARKALAGVGIGVVSLAGLTVLKDQVDSMVRAALGGLAADAYSVLALAGFIDVVNIWLAALTIVVTLAGGKRLGLL